MFNRLLPRAYRKASLALATSALLLCTLASAKAETFSLSIGFDNTIDREMTGNLVGFGLLSYTADTQLADGSYSLDSFQDLVLELNFGGFIFTQADLVTPSAQVSIEIRNGGFTFSNASHSDVVVGLNGAADFIRGENYVTTEPFQPNGGPRGGANGENALYNASIDGKDFNGSYAAVPEPSTYAMIIVGAGMCIVFARRKRCWQ